MTIHVPKAFDTVGGGELPFSEVHQQFASSHFGQHLAGQVRYRRYKPEGVSNKQWSQAPLGMDTNNLTHMPVTANLAKEYLRHQDPEAALNHTDSQVLVLTAMIHDWAEGIISDISFDQKTEEDKDDEATMMLFLLKKMFKGKLSQETIMLIHKTSQDRSTRLGEIFSAIEGVGYMRTGIHAWEASQKPDGEVMRNISSELERELRVNLQWLAGNVAGNQTEQLIEYARKFAPISKYIGNVRNRISGLFKGMPIVAFQKYPKQDEQFMQLKKFLQASNTWRASEFHAEGCDIDKENDQVSQSD